MLFPLEITDNDTQQPLENRLDSLISEIMQQTAYVPRLKQLVYETLRYFWCVRSLQHTNGVKQNNKTRFNEHLGTKAKVNKTSYFVNSELNKVSASD